MRNKFLPFFFFLLGISMTGFSQFGWPLTDATLAAGGAVAAHQLSHGNPLATAGGAAAGVLLGEGIHAWKTRSEQRAFQHGFERGRSDGVKQLYWNLQESQRNQPGFAQPFSVNVPAREEGGVRFNATQQTID